MGNRGLLAVRPAVPYSSTWPDRLRRFFILVLIGAVYIWAAQGTRLSITDLVSGWPYFVDILSRMFPPRLDALPGLIKPTVETIQISLIGTTMAVFLTIPFGLLAARNVAPYPVIYQTSRFILNATRSINEMIFALIFVATVGLGPFPGVLALGIHSIGMMGKFLADSIEGIDPGPVEALQAAGASRLQIIRYAMLPQVTPEFISLCLYRLELNFRSATVLGIVGAGGIGFELITSLRLFMYQDTTSILLVILITVILVDTFCSWIRKRII